ncbi:flagellar export chaperone FlgN [Algibacillus agarilyticus]|uniref:flagellar export chaperone FlgN n=1 Tax=Algibacillus agarilyticus TaxID=2234133 RepID=UPI001E2CAF48|nr:flagellar export chaperone FlgN [Algibacillus agarilyticus]
MKIALDVLTQQLKNLDKLTNLLAAELEAFTKRQPDNIITIAEQKIQLLNEITDIDIQLAALPDLEQIKKEPSIKQLITQCDEKLTALKTQNSVNERVIKTSLNNVSRLKQSLLSLKNADAMTYDKKGQAMTQTLGTGIKA